MKVGDKLLSKNYNRNLYNDVILGEGFISGFLYTIVYICPMEINKGFNTIRLRYRRGGRDYYMTLHDDITGAYYYGNFFYTIDEVRKLKLDKINGA